MWAVASGFFYPWVFLSYLFLFVQRLVIFIGIIPSHLIFEGYFEIFSGRQQPYVLFLLGGGCTDPMSSNYQKCSGHTFLAAGKCVLQSDTDSDRASA